MKKSFVKDFGSSSKLSETAINLKPELDELFDKVGLLKNRIEWANIKNGGNIRHAIEGGLCGLVGERWKKIHDPEESLCFYARNLLELFEESKAGNKDTSNAPKIESAIAVCKKYVSFPVKKSNSKPGQQIDQSKRGEVLDKLVKIFNHTREISIEDLCHLTRITRPELMEILFDQTIIKNVVLEGQYVKVEREGLLQKITRFVEKYLK